MILLVNKFTRGQVDKFDKLTSKQVVC